MNHESRLTSTDIAWVIYLSFLAHPFLKATTRRTLATVLTSSLSHDTAFQTSQINAQQAQDAAQFPAQTAENTMTSRETIITRYTLALREQKRSANTIKNYISDVDTFLAFYDALPLTQILTKPNTTSYAHLLEKSGLSRTTIERKMSAIRGFAHWAAAKGFIHTDPFPSESFQSGRGLLPGFHITTSYKPSPQETSNNNHGAGLKVRLARAYERYHSYPLTSYLHLSILVVAAMFMGFLGYTQIMNNTRQSFAFPTSLNRPNRSLSFQARLTDASSTPITAATNLVFKLWTLSSGGSQLWTSGTCSITPDSNGIFSTLLGSSCGSEITSDVFSENANVWLEITVGAETLTPRQQIATVGYALNSETLQGYPASASAMPNTVPVMDNTGTIVLGWGASTIQSTLGTFAIKGNALTLSTNTSTNGNIQFAPDGTGQVNVIGGTTSTNTFTVSNASLTTGNLITGSVANNNTGYKLISLQSGSSPTEKFSVDALGNVTEKGYFSAPGATISATYSSATPLIVNGTGGQIFSIANSGTLTIPGYTTDKGILFTNGSGVVSQTAQGAAGTVLHGNGSSNPTFAAIDLTADVGSSVLPIANGGTNSTATPTNGGIAYGTGTAYAFSVAGSAGQCLVSNGAAAPTWTACASGANNLWQLNAQVISPGNSTYDLAIGGTATSSALFQVFGTSGNATTSGNLTFAGTNSTNLIAARNKAGLTLGDSQTGNIIFNGGNVGILNSTPQAALDITGTASISSTLTMGGAIQPSTGNLTLNYKSGTNTWAAGLTLNGLGNVGIGTVSPGSQFGVNAGTSSTIAEIIKGASSQTANLSEWRNSSGTGLSAITANGYIGIGTTSISNVAGWGGGNQVDQLYLKNTNGGSFPAIAIQAGSGGGGAIQFVDSAGSPGADFGYVENGEVGFANRSSGQPINFYTAGPTLKFSVRPTYSNFTTGITVNGSGTPVSALDVVGNASFGTYANVNAAPTNGLIVSGNTGIGTSSPASLFSVGSSSQFQVNSSGAIAAATGITSSGTITFSTFTTNKGILYTDGSGVVAQTAQGASNQCLVGNGTGAPSWSSCAAGASHLWQLNTQVISPGNSTLDLAVGGTATSSALFQIFGTSGNATSAGSLTFAGTPSTNVIAARNKAGLTLGDSQTGNIIFNGGRVGIGTNQPEALFHILGDQASSYPFIVQQSNSNTELALFRNLSGNDMFHITLQGANNIPTFYDNNSGSPVASISLKAGSVGIGTQSPASLFSVGSSSQFQVNSSGAIAAATGITSSGTITFSTFTTNKGILYTDGSGVVAQTAQGASNQCLVGNGTSAPSWSACAAGASHLWQLNTQVISPGNSTLDLAVGGTATASAKFLVQGSTGFTTIGSGLTAQAPLYISSGFGANAAMIVNNLNSGDLFAASASGTTRFRIDNSGNAIAATFQDSANTAYYLDPANAGVSLAAAGDATAGGRLIIGGTSGIIQPADGSLTLNYKSAINTWSAGITLQPTTGNVGILNTNPKTVLDVTGTASISSTLTLGGAIQPSNGPLTLNYKSGTNSWLPALTLDTVGNIGVGTTTPVAPLHLSTGFGANAALIVNNTLSGDILAASASGATKFRISNTGNIISVAGANWQPLTNATNALNIANAAGTSFVSFDTTNSRVGIGTTAPTRAFEINSNNAALAIRDSGSGKRFLFTNVAANDSTLGLYDENNSTFRWMVTSTGNMGIGSTSPNALLDVNGTASISGVLTMGSAIQPANGPLSFNYKSGTNAWSGAMLIDTLGNVGIGTSVPAQKLDVNGNIIISAGGRKVILGDVTTTNAGLYFNTASDTNYYIGRDSTAWGSGQPLIYRSFYGHMITSTGQSATASATIENADTGTDADGLAIKLGFTSSVGGSCNTGGACNEFVTFMNGNGLKLGKIYASAASGANTVTYKTNGNDMAEYFKKQSSESFEPGDVVSMYGDGAIRPTQESDPKLLGIVTTTPGFVGGDDDGNSVLVALVGQVPLKIDPASEPIEKGDMLTSSDVKGMAKKATGPGYVVGKALESWQPSQGHRKINTFIHVGYMDPDRSLDASLSLTGLISFADVPDPSAPYTLKDAAGKQIRHVIRSSQAAIGNLTAGFIQTKQLVADSIRVGGVSLEQYIRNVVQTLPRSSGSDIARTVDPQSGVENLMITLGSTATSSSPSVLKITDRALHTVASIDETGNATFAGTLQATNLHVNDASISGILYANQIDGLKERVASLVSGEIASTSAELLASLSGNNSAILDRVSLLEDKTHPIASGSSLLAADTLFITDSINVAGSADLGSAIIHAGLTVGNTLALDGTSIGTSETTLSLQPSGMGRIDMLAGAMTLDQTSGLVVGVNTVFAKNVTILEDLITSSITPTENLTIQFATESGTLSHKLAIQNQAGDEVSSINSRGEASFTKLVIAVDNSASSASISGELHTNATTGGAVLPVGATTITLVSNQITANSRIYVTPTSSTNNQVLYVASLQGATGSEEGRAVIAIDAALSVPLSFNWWIIN